MQYVGGFASWEALVRWTATVDERAYEDVLIAMAGDAEARKLAAMQAAYETERDAQGRLPATWEVIYAAGFAAERSGRGGGRGAGGEVVVPLSRLGRR